MGIALVLRQSFISTELFAGDNCLAGANFCAATALDALVRVDVIDIALRDSLNGANRHAGAASNARIGDYVSHD